MTQLRDTNEDQYAQHRLQVEAEESIKAAAKPSQLWKERMAEQQAQALLPDPTRIAAIWSTKRRPDVKEPFWGVMAPGQSQWVDTMEGAFNKSGGIVPVGSLVDMDVSDLDLLLASGEFSPEFLVEMNYNQFAAREQARMDEEQIQRKFDAANSSGQVWGATVMTGLQGIFEGGMLAFSLGTNPIDWDSLEKTAQKITPTREMIKAELETTDYGRNVAAAYDEEVTEWRDGQRDIFARRVLLNEMGKEDKEIAEAGLTLLHETTYSDLTDIQKARTDHLLGLAERALLDQINAGGDVRSLTGRQSVAESVLGAGAGALTEFMQGGAYTLEWVARKWDWITPGTDPNHWWHNPYQASLRNFEQAQGTQIEDLQADKVTEGQKLLEVGAITGRQAWDMDKIENPDLTQQLLDAADGDEFQAMGFYIASRNQHEEVRELNQQMLDNANEADEALIVDLQERNYRLGDDVLNSLAVYGRNVPGRLATVFTLFMTDEEYWETFTSGDIKKLWDDIGKESSKLGHTPSEALGLEGSMAGLVADMGLMAVFDPMTWIFGPRLTVAARGALGSTKAGVLQMAKGPIVSRMTKDLMLAYNGPGRGSTAAYHIADWLDPTGQNQLMGALNFKSQQFRHNNWMFDDASSGAVMVETKFLDDVFDPAKRNIGGVDEVANNISETGGFDEALTVEVSRADGTMRLKDGNKRYLAAVQEEWRQVPVKFEMVDDSFKIPDFLDDAGETTMAQLDEVRQFDYTDGGRHAAARDVDPGKINIEETVAAIKNGDLTPTELIGEGFEVYVDNRNQILMVDGNHRLAILEMVDYDGPVKAFITPVDDIDALVSGLAREGDVAGLASRPISTEVHAARLTDMAADSNVLEKLASTKLGKGAQTFDPHDVFNNIDILGGVDETLIRRIVEESMLRGALPNQLGRSILRRTMPSRVRQIIRKGTPAEVRSLFTQVNTSSQIKAIGPEAGRELLDNTAMLWGEDLAKADLWTERILEIQHQAYKTVGENQQRMAVLNGEIRHLKVQEEALARLASTRKSEALSPAEKLVLDGQYSAEAQLVDAQRLALESRVDEVTSQLARSRGQQDMARLTKEMWEDFNRSKIAPRWDPSDLDSSGMLPWEKLREGFRRDSRFAKGQTEDWVPDTLRDLADAEGIPVDRLAALMHGSPDDPMILNLPLSPLDMLAAATMTGKAWTRWVKQSSVNSIRTLAGWLHEAWVIDKVLRPATAMTVSADELLRIFHQTGRQGVQRYVADRALFTQARVQSALHGGNPLSRTAVARGSNWSPRTTQRLQELAEHAQATRAFESVYYDGYGLGVVDIHPGAPEYAAQAQQWTNAMLEQSGFKAYLRGEEAFTEWYWSLDGEAARNTTVIRQQAGRPVTVPLDGPAALYAGMDSYFERIVLAKASKQGSAEFVRDAFVKAARESDELGRVVPVEEAVFNHLGPIRGYQRHMKADMNPTRMTDHFFDRTFTDPVNYRRGFLATFTAKQEKARLQSLFASQGKRIVTDLELQSQLGIKGMHGVTKYGVRTYLDDLAMQNGMVTEGYIDMMVQRVVNREMEHVLYNAEQGSRAGRAVSKTVFPFGKPWADMAAYWGREGMRRPVMRGVYNEKNLGFVGDVLSLGGRFNPKTASLISRMAHTDFTIDRGWFGTQEGETAGLFPGTEKSDLSPFLFLPTGGDSAFGAILPGVGFIPAIVFDLVAQNMFDPKEDPEGWQNFIDEISDVVPSARFGSPSLVQSAIQRVAGGGTTAQLVEGAMNIQGTLGQGGAYGPINTMLGQPDHMIDRTRAATAIMADEFEWDDLLNALTADDLNTVIDAIAMDADQRAAKGNLMEQITRFGLPISSKYSGDLDQIYDVWVTGGTNFSQINPDSGFDLESASPEDRRRYADGVRRMFFALPSFEKDLLLVQQKTLAVNLVSNWEWTPAGIGQGLDDTNEAYRVTPSSAGLARHQVYVNAGWIKVLEPAERIRRILGAYQAAQTSVSKSIYANTAEAVNEILWNTVVDNQTKKNLQIIVDHNPEITTALGVTSIRELWSNWSNLEAVYENRFADSMNIERVKGESRKKEDLTAFDKLRIEITIPEDHKAWGTTWPGMDPDKLTSRFTKITIDTLPDDVRRAGEALGLDLIDGMTGRQLYAEAHQSYIDTFGALSLAVSSEYETYIGELGKAATIAERNLNAVAFNPQYDDQFRKKVQDFKTFEGLLHDRVRDTGGRAKAPDSLEVQQRYMALMDAGWDLPNIDWLEIWEDRYERRYGPLGWEAATPPGITDLAYEPVIVRVSDGDSLIVRTGPSDYRAHRVRLLGVRARETREDGGLEDTERLMKAIREAVAADIPIRLVREPGVYGNVDPFGRELAWLYIGDEPFFFPEELDPRRDPSGGDNR